MADTTQYATQLVAGLYRVILGREPDAEGLAVHVGSLLGSQDPLAVDTLITAFMEGVEGRALREKSHRRMALEDAARSLAIGAPEHTLISLGSFCYTASLMQRAGLKRESHPFDWLFSSPEMVAHCLDDDFATFLDPRYYETVPLEMRAAPHVNRCDHAYYRDRFGIPFVFNHRDPTIPADYAYLLRCVERLRAQARSGRRLSLICSFRDDDEASSRFVALERSVRSYFAAGFLIGIAVADASDVALPELRAVLRTERGELVHFQAISAWQDVQFAAALDDFSLLSGLSRMLFGRGNAMDE